MKIVCSLSVVISVERMLSLMCYILTKSVSHFQGRSSSIVLDKKSVLTISSLHWSLNDRLVLDVGDDLGSSGSLGGGLSLLELGLESGILFLLLGEVGESLSLSVELGLVSGLLLKLGFGLVLLGAAFSDLLQEELVVSLVLVGVLASNTGLAKDLPRGAGYLTRSTKDACVGALTRIRLVLANRAVLTGRLIHLPLVRVELAGCTVLTCV